MHNPIDKMSTYAAKLALNLSKSGYSPPNKHQFEASLVSRQTVNAIQKIG
jgi:LacI family transcriptional regulator